VDDQLCHGDDQPTIGLPFARKDRLIVEYPCATKKPIGVAERRTRLVESRRRN
jgi:hypothetical protein